VYSVLVVEPIHEKGIELLKKETEVAVGNINADIQVFFERYIEKADAIITRGLFPVNKDLIEKGKNLKVIGVHGAGYNHIDVHSATSRRILVVNTPGITAEAVAEHVLGLMLALTKRIAYADRRLRSESSPTQDEPEMSP